MHQVYRIGKPSIKDTAVTRSHYPSDSLYLGKPVPYRNVFPKGKRTRTCSYLAEYVIGRNFERFHSNPPIWKDSHIHNFRVEITLSSLLRPGDLYGVDMIEAEKHLQELCDRVPLSVNEMFQCASGTTEDLCAYFLNAFSLPDNLIVLKQVMVSENQDRKTILFSDTSFRDVR